MCWCVYESVYYICAYVLAHVCARQVFEIVAGVRLSARLDFEDSRFAFDFVWLDYLLLPLVGGLYFNTLLYSFAKYSCRSQVADCVPPNCFLHFSSTAAVTAAAVPAAAPAAPPTTAAAAAAAAVVGIVHS